MIFDIARIKAQNIPYGASPNCEIKTERKDVRKAYKIVFPKRYMKYTDLENRRMLKKEGFPAIPEELFIAEAKIDKKIKLAIITHTERQKANMAKDEPTYQKSLLTPIGLVEYPPLYEDDNGRFRIVKTPREAYKAITGKDIPKNKDIASDVIANEITLAVLANRTKS